MRHSVEHGFDNCGDPVCDAFPQRGPPGFQMAASHCPCEAGFVLVFLSYRRRDSAFAAQALRYALRGAGHEVFIDIGAITPGDAFRDVIRDAMGRSQLVLVLIGPQFDAGRLHEPLDPVAFEWRQARFLGCMVHAVLVDGASMPAEHTVPSDLRWFCKRSASTLGGAWLGQQIDAIVEEVPHLAVQPRGAARVLWVDDRPANNEYERSLLRGDGIVFDNVVSTAEAIEQLCTSTYDLVITDLGRRWSSDRSQVAGRELLSHSVIADGGPPVVVYAGREAIRQEGELLALGAFGVSQNREHMLTLVRQALGRSGS
jgi:CheY-like chemotaxis protein